MNDLIIVFTPLQFLNALEYTRQENRFCKITVLTGDKSNKEQIKKVDYNKQAKFPLSAFNAFPNKLFCLIGLLYLKHLLFKNYKCVVIGNYNNVIGYSAAHGFYKKGSKVVLLDDGLATIKLFLNRNATKQTQNIDIFPTGCLLSQNYFLELKKTQTFIV